MQLPAEAQDSEAKLTFGFAAAPAGRGASTPGTQVPAVSVSNSPWESPEKSKVSPTAVQLPAEAHDTELRSASVEPPGRDAWTPGAQVPAVSVSSSPAGFPSSRCTGRPRRSCPPRHTIPMTGKPPD